LIVNTVNSAIDSSGSGVAHIPGYVDSTGTLSLKSGSTGINSQITPTMGNTVLNDVLGGSGTILGSKAAGDTGTDNYD